MFEDEVNSLLTELEELHSNKPELRSKKLIDDNCEKIKIKKRKFENILAVKNHDLLA